LHGNYSPKLCVLSLSVLPAAGTPPSFASLGEGKKPAALLGTPQLGQAFLKIALLILEHFWGGA
jgi:hypothetical protein